jgi:hypothetical protein
MQQEKKKTLEKHRKTRSSQFKRHGKGLLNRAGIVNTVDHSKPRKSENLSPAAFSRAISCFNQS